MPSLMPKIKRGDSHPVESRAGSKGLPTERITVKRGSWRRTAVCMALWGCMSVVVLDSIDLGVLENRRLEREQAIASGQVVESVPSYIREKAPQVSARSAVVLDQKTGRVLYDKNKEAQVYPASTTKIMTALLALEHKKLTDQVQISSEALQTEGSAIYLQEGERITMEDLLYGLMLRSGNDAALAIAQGVSGDVEKFVVLMNERAKTLGARHTQFVNPNGLHDERHYTTALDMALIAREAMECGAFRQIVGTKNWTAHRERGLYNDFYNKNKVVHQYEGGTGIKIGYTKATGRTLVASSQREGMELICVVMDADDWFEDSYKLMDFVYSNYTMKTIAQGQQPLRKVAVQGGQAAFVSVGPKETIACPVANGETEGGGEAGDITIQYEGKQGCRAPVSRWQEAGSLRMYVKGNLIGKEPLYYMEDIEQEACK